MINLFVVLQYFSSELIDKKELKFSLLTFTIVQKNIRN
jgi:hypothetical protein